MNVTADAWDRFWNKVDMFAADGCWVWQNSIDTSNYGLFRFRKRIWKAHRLAWTWLVGEIPANRQVHHHCFNTRCVNPDHLEVVTQTENLIVHGKTNFGYKNARKTHCPQGHEYNAENTYRSPSQPGRRRCLTCTRKRGREYQRAKRLRKRAP